MPLTFVFVTLVLLWCRNWFNLSPAPFPATPELTSANPADMGGNEGGRGGAEKWSLFGTRSSTDPGSETNTGEQATQASLGRTCTPEPQYHHHSAAAVAMNHPGLSLKICSLNGTAGLNICVSPGFSLQSYFGLPKSTTMDSINTQVSLMVDDPSSFNPPKIEISGIDAQRVAQRPHKLKPRDMNVPTPSGF